MNSNAYLLFFVTLAGGGRKLAIPIHRVVWIADEGGKAVVKLDGCSNLICTDDPVRGVIEAYERNL